MPYARKRFGQHFLSDPSFIHRFIDALNLQPTDRLIEIGPGRGALTFPLLEHIPTLTAIEIDSDLCQFLRQKIPSPENLNLIEADILKVHFHTVCQEYSLPPPLRLIGNLPYNISTPFLFSLLPALSLLQDTHFMLQKEVVDRMVAQPRSKEYGRLSVMLQYYFRIEKLWDLPPTAFSPPPKVFSSIVRLIPHSTETRPYQVADETKLALLVKTAFLQRRKTLRKALCSLITDPHNYQQVSIDPSRRAETLSVKEWVSLSNQ
jgi:16S rRNA (adenine1518-N6/adenine1519-N6)-dimethyltransferase